MEPIYYAIFAINGFTASVWILLFIYTLISDRLANKFRAKNSLVSRGAFKIKDDSVPTGGNTLEENDNPKDIGKGRGGNGDREQGLPDIKQKARQL